MRKQRLNEAALALSQLMPLCIQRNTFSEQMRLLMPFLTLKTANYQLARNNFTQANRLTELVWGESHALIFSNQSHRHNHILSQYENTSDGNWSIAFQDNRQSNKNHNEIDPTRKDKDTSLKSNLEVKAAQVEKNQAYSVNPEQIDPQSFSRSDNDELGQETIINHTLAFRPFFYQVKQTAAGSLVHYKSRLADKANAMQLMGLLSGRNAVRRQPAVASLNNESKPSNLSNSESMAMQPQVSWSISLLRAQQEFATSEPNKHVKTNFALIDSLSKSYAIQSQDLIEVAEYSKNILATSNFNNKSASRLDISPDEPQALPNYNSPLPKNMPYKSKSPHQQNEFLGVSSINSNLLAEKIEEVVAEKFKAFKAGDGRHTADINLIKQDIKNKLAPERLVSDELIRVLLKKLRKDALEKRFRLGLLN